MRPLAGIALAALLLAAVFAGPLFALAVAPEGSVAHNLHAPAAALPPDVRLEGRPSRLLFGSFASLDPARDAVLVLRPLAAYSSSDARDALEFLRAGGRILVADDHSVGATFVRDLGVGVELSDAHVYSPDFQNDAGDLVCRSTGVVAGMPAQIVLTHPVVVHGGTPLVVAPPLSWEDRNDNRRPDLDEPLLSGSLAASVPVGAGELIVVGDSALLAARSQSRDAFLDHLARDGRSIVVDAGHEAQSNPLGTNALLGGRLGVASASGILIVTVAITAFVVLGPRLQAMRRPAARLGPVHGVSRAVLSDMLQELDRE